MASLVTLNHTLVCFAWDDFTRSLLEFSPVRGLGDKIRVYLLRRAIYPTSYIRCCRQRNMSITWHSPPVRCLHFIVTKFLTNLKSSNIRYTSQIPYWLTSINGVKLKTVQVKSPQGQSGKTQNIPGTNRRDGSGIGHIPQWPSMKTGMWEYVVQSHPWRRQPLWSDRSRAKRFTPTVPTPTTVSTSRCQQSE